uniref:Uncharacterized protein n=1 Tax=Rhizophora mucronata TaxID=61149 RepID=A0A2P2LG33_RHIMU
MVLRPTTAPPQPSASFMPYGDLKYSSTSFEI